MASVLRRVRIVVRSTRTGLKHRAHLLWVIPGRDAFMREDGVVPIEISASPSLLGTRLRYWPCPGGPSPQHLQCPCPPAASA